MFMTRVHLKILRDGRRYNSVPEGFVAWLLAYLYAPLLTQALHSERFEDLPVEHAQMDSLLEEGSRINSLHRGFVCGHLTLEELSRWQECFRDIPREHLSIAGFIPLVCPHAVVCLGSLVLMGCSGPPPRPVSCGMYC